MNNYYEKKINLSDLDFDAYDYLNPFACLKYFQNISGEHAELLNCGYETMKSLGIVWIVVRTKIDINSSPNLNTNLIISTKVKKIRGISVDREYIIKDANTDKVYVTGQSMWCLMSFKNRKLEKPTILKEPDVFDTNYIYKNSLRTISDFDIQNSNDYKSYTIPFVDIDHNLHLNNCKYADYVINTINPTKERKVKSLEINYEHEIIQNEHIRIYYKEIAFNQYLLKALDDNDSIRFKASIIFDKKN